MRIAPVAVFAVVAVVVVVVVAVVVNVVVSASAGFVRPAARVRRYYAAHLARIELATTGAIEIS